MRPFVKYGLLVILSGWLLIKGVLPAWTTVYSDFSNYFVSSQLVLENNTEKLYDNEWFQQQLNIHGIDGRGKFAPFPPLSAWVLLPLAGTDALTAMRIWVIINVIFLGACVFLIRDLTHWEWPDALLMMLATGNGLVNNFRFGQMYLLITAGLFFVLWLAKRNAFWWGGLVLGALSWFKYVPVVLLGGWVILKKFKIPFTTAISMTGLLILQFVFFGSSLMGEFFFTTLLPHLDGNLEGQDMFSFLFQSWDNFFRHLFVFSETHNPEPIFDWAVGRTLAKGVIYLVVAISLFFSIKKVLALPLSEYSKQVILSSYFFLAAFVILPASATYHFILLAVPLTLLVHCDFFYPREKILMVLIFFLIGFIPYNFFFALAERGGLFFAYPRLWLTSILFIACIRPVFVRRDQSGFVRSEI